MRLGLLVSGLSGSATVDVARSAESEGLASCWIIEDLWNRGAIPLASACLEATQRIDIAIGVVNPYTRHPTLFAMDYGALAELYEGRAIIGIGASVQAWVEQMGLEYHMPRTATMEAIEIARELLAGQESNYSGRVFQTHGITLGFSTEHRAPMYMGAMGERTVRACGAVADGWVVSLLEPIGYVRKAREWLRQGAADAQRVLGDFPVVQYFPFSCNEDSRAAKAAVKPLMAIYLAGEFGLYEQQTAVMRSLTEHLVTIDAAGYRDVLRKLAEGVDPVVAIPDELVDELAIAGTPRECADKLGEYAAVGVTEAALFPADGDFAAAARVMGRELRPLLAGQGL